MAMQEIDKLRSEIDSIHRELATLFRCRLQLTIKIWEIKKSGNLPLIDPKRENEIIHQFDDFISDGPEKAAVQSFFKNLLGDTRVYLKEKLK